MNHTEWQALVVDVARVYRWQHLHVRRTIGRGRHWVTATNIKGWPDLFLWHELQQRTLAAELKIPPDDLSPDQAAVLESLARAGVETHVWRPDDLDLVHAALRSPALVIPTTSTPP
jgi:hypothetical protein